MAYTKTISRKEDLNSSYQATWTYKLTGHDDVASASTFAITPVSITAKYVYSGKTACCTGPAIHYLINGEDTNFLTWHGGPNGVHDWNKQAMASNTEFAVDAWGTGSVKTLSTSKYFNANNPTVRTLDISAVIGAFNNASDNKTGYDDGTMHNSIYYATNVPVGAVSTVTLDAPPTFTASTMSKDTADYVSSITNVSVTVSNSSAKYGGTIESSSLSVGSQTVTGNGNGTLTMRLANAGTYTPTVSVTDSRGQVTTKTLSEITVLQYNNPSVNFDVFRTNANGVKNDEGTYGLINATITYTDAVATLTEPAVAIGGMATSNVTWYSSYNSTTGVQGLTPISNWSSLTPLNHAVTVYGLVNGSFNTEQSYAISMTDTDSLGGISQTVTQTLSTAFYTIDFLAGGKEIAFGAPANDVLTTKQENIGLFKCDMDTRFNDMTSQEVDDFVDSLSYSQIIAIDYVVEQGSSGMWTYRKWNSGVAECWGCETISFTSPSTYGNFKYQTISDRLFPTGLFITAPILTVSVNKPTGSGMPFASILGLNADHFSYYIGDPNTSAISYTAVPQFSAKGRWK